MSGIRPGVGPARPGPDRREAEPRHGAGAAPGAHTLRPQVPQVSLLHARLHQHQASQAVFLTQCFLSGSVSVVWDLLDVDPQQNFWGNYSFLHWSDFKNVFLPT